MVCHLLAICMLLAPSREAWHQKGLLRAGTASLFLAYGAFDIPSSPLGTGHTPLGSPTHPLTPPAHRALAHSLAGMFSTPPTPAQATGSSNALLAVWSTLGNAMLLFASHSSTSCSRGAV